MCKVRCKNRGTKQEANSEMIPPKYSKMSSHISIRETAGIENRAPGKSYIYRVNTSFSKETKSPGGITSESNLPTISQNNTSTSSKECGGKKKAKLLKQDSSIKGKINAKEVINKRQKVQKEGTPKTKAMNEYTKLKQKGDLKWMPKLCIDVPMTAERVKHIDNWYENDGKWNYRVLNKEDYQRREQIRSLNADSKSFKVVYDNIDRSPFYTDPNIPYLDDNKLLPDKDNNANFTQSRYKARGYRRPLINSGMPRKDKIYTSLNPYYVVQGDDDTTLVFESRFECGNLK